MARGGEDLRTALRRFELNENGMGDAQTNTTPFSPRLKTYEGRQYFPYWNHAGELVVAVRDLPEGDWKENNTGIEIGARDGHWTPALGIGPDGHVFVSYNTRNSSIKWRRSDAPADITSFGSERVGMTGQNEDSATYPDFTRLFDGTLIFGYRNGYSGNGDWTLNRWNESTEQWKILQHPMTDGEGERNSYHWNFIQSNDGVLHSFFNWRGTGGVQTNTQLSYAQSPDGGETWERSDGTPYSGPITKSSSEIVDDIDRGSDFINNGWASFDPQTNAPHVAYYRDDVDGNTQIFHAYLDDGWVIEPATDRHSSVDFGGGGTIASPIARMGIVVGDSGDVHILTRDYERGSWPILVEKLDDEWQTSLLYKRNMLWSDVHIDPERWRSDRVLSFVDQQQNVRAAPWSEETLIGITDVDVEALNRGNRSMSLSNDRHERMTTFISTDVARPPATTTSTSFEDTSTALAFSEATLQGTPTFARLTVHLDSSAEAGGAAARLKIQSDAGGGVTYSDPVKYAGEEHVLQTDWTRVPTTVRAGFINMQIRSSSTDATTQVTKGTLEVAYEDPTPFGHTVVPEGGEER